MEMPRYNSADIQNQPVIARFYAFRAACQHLGIVGFEIHVCEDRALRLDPVDPFKRPVEMRMCRMRIVAQAIDDPNLCPFQRRKGSFIQHLSLIHI